MHALFFLFLLSTVKGVQSYNIITCLHLRGGWLQSVKVLLREE